MATEINHSSWGHRSHLCHGTCTGYSLCLSSLGANLENHGESDIPTGKKLMQVELLAQFSDDVLPRARMMDLGVKAVRGPRRLTKELIDVLTSEVINIY